MDPTDALTPDVTGGEHSHRGGHHVQILTLSLSLVGIRAGTKVINKTLTDTHNNASLRHEAVYLR